MVNMSPELADELLLEKFRTDATKEAGFTGIIKKYQEKLYWHVRRMVAVSYTHSPSPRD